MSTTKNKVKRIKENRRVTMKMLADFWRYNRCPQPVLPVVFKNAHRWVQKLAVLWHFLPNYDGEEFSNQIVICDKRLWFYSRIDTTIEHGDTQTTMSAQKLWALYAGTNFCLYILVLVCRFQTQFVISKIRFINKFVREFNTIRY